MPAYPNVYRADVEDADDPDQRLRVRVRVQGVHPPELEVEDLPWADIVGTFGRGMRGFFFPYEKGDTVFVQFEAGDVRHPLVVGGCLSRAAGVNDIPFDMQGDLAGGHRVMLVDAKGNTLEMSTAPGDSWIRMKAGGAEVRVDAQDSGVVVDAAGPVTVRGTTVKVQSNVAEVSASTVNIDARTGATSSGVATLDSDSRTDILSGKSVNIGGRVENVVGIPTPPNPALPGSAQAEEVNIRSKDVNVGVGSAILDAALATLGRTPAAETDAMPTPVPGLDAPPVPLLPTLTVNIRAVAEVNVDSAASINIRSGTTAIKSLVAVSINAPLITMGA